MITGTHREELRSRLRGCGFDLVGFAPPSVPESAGRLAHWLSEGRHGDMAWMEKDPGVRTDVRRRWPEAGA